MSQNRQYELIYVVSSDATDQQITDLHTQVEEIVARFSGTCATHQRTLQTEIKRARQLALLPYVTE